MNVFVPNIDRHKHEIKKLTNLTDFYLDWFGLNSAPLKS